MLPVIALVGRPNVGKSTLFNRLTRSRDALVADLPGLTRDRQYGIGRVGEFPYVVVDTGGISGVHEGLDPLMEQQVWRAIGEADHILFLVDAREGRNAGDEVIAEHLRRSGKAVTLVVNKCDGIDAEIARSDFYGLSGLEPVTIAAAHGRGVSALVDMVLATLTPPQPMDEEQRGIRVAVVGRPNVGKSTLINRLIGEQRLVAFDMPGTTRDSIAVPHEVNGQHFTLIDTAGVRKRGRISEAVEKFSVVKTLQAIEESHVVLMLLDARQGVTEQDSHLAGHILESGRALVMVVNKWDGLSPQQRDKVKEELQRRLYFLDFASWHYVSALHGSGVGDLLKNVQHAYANAVREFKTSRLTEILEGIVTEHQPPLVNGRRIKLRYAHQGGKNPPRIIIHGKQTEALPESYRRYLTKRFHKLLQLKGTPLRVEFRTADNPFEKNRQKRSGLTPGQRYRLNSKRGRKNPQGS